MGVVLMRRGEDNASNRQTPEEEDQGAQLRELVGVLSRRRSIVVAVGVIVFTAILAYALLSPRLYRATALVMVNPAREQVLAQTQMIENAAPNSSVVDSEIEILKSQMLMRRLVETLKLDENPEWNAALRNPSPIEAVQARVSSMLNRAGSAAPPRTAQTLRENVAMVVGRSVVVRRRGMSYGIEVAVESRSPRQAALMADTLAELYLRSQTEARFEAAQRANTWLSARLEELRLEVQAKERAAEAFRSARGLSLAAGGETGVSQSDDVQTMLVAARADLAEKEARLRQLQDLIRSGGSAETSAAALASPVIGELRSREAELAQRQRELEQRYSGEHPALQTARAEFEEVTQRIREETARITTNLRDEVEIARTRLNTLQSSFGATSGARGEDNDAVIQYRQLLREAAAARAVHENFLERFHEVAEQGDLPAATSRLVSNATAPVTPSKPDLKLALLIALLGAVLAGIGAAVLADVFDGSMTSAEDVERKIGVPTVASIPVLRAADYRGLPAHRRNPADYLVDKPMSAFAEALRVLRTAVMYARLDTKVRVLAITSAVPNEGKTTMSLSLARICAMSGQRVVLVDCDLRRQSLSEMLGLPLTNGLVDVLTGQTDWRKALVQDPDTTAAILPSVSTTFTPRDLFSSPQMHALIDDLRLHYDIVILDCAPVLAIAEARVVVTHADLVALVARSEKTPAAAARTALREVRNAGADVLGVALNYVDPRAPGRASYGDTLYYRHASKNYYRD